MLKVWQGLIRTLDMDRTEVCFLFVAASGFAGVAATLLMLFN
ncbi:hypothetical protein [Bradyrhizobium sp. NP1]|jgi:hypothetical protein|nr:hypothetical protein [Bradyrhizobium sp. NP1]WJR75600.1 hypothetical protein QOU61_22695 [Bradyrhizobium sp. NP1]